MTKSLWMRPAAAAALALSAAVAGAAEITDLSSDTALWHPYSGPSAKTMPAVELVDGPEGGKAIQITAKADGKWQCLQFVPGSPLAVENGDVLKMKIRQTASPTPVPMVIYGNFTNGNLHCGLPAVGSDWTEVSVPMDASKWSADKIAPESLGAIKVLSINVSGGGMDVAGETVAIASMQLVKADGSVRECQLPDSLTPTEAEAKWMDSSVCSGYPGAQKTPPEISVKDQVVTAKVVAQGGYQGLDVNFPEPVDLAKYKAVVMDVKQNASDKVVLWFYYVANGGIMATASAGNNHWTSIRVDLDYKNLQALSKAAEAQAGKVKCLRINCGGSLKAPGQMLAIRNLHFIPKSAEEVAAAARSSLSEVDEW